MKIVGLFTSGPFAGLVQASAPSPQAAGWAADFKTERMTGSRAASNGRGGGSNSTSCAETSALARLR